MTDLPTTRAEWSDRGPVVRRTLADPVPLAVAVVVGLLVALVASASRRLRFVADVLGSGGLSLGFKAEFLLLHLPGLGTMAGPLQGIATVAVAAIAGVTAAMLARTILTGSESASGRADRDAGLVFGIFGIALAALGPAVLAGVAGLAGVDGALAALPLRGLEGSVLAVPLLALSTYWLACGLEDGRNGDGSAVPGDR